MHASKLIFYLGGLSLVLALYAAKFVILHFAQSRRAALAAFVAITLAAVPLAWLLSPDWHNSNVRQIANWIGTPLILLTVPTASFLYDYLRETGTWNFGRLWAEVFIAVPIWGVVWVGIEIFILRWTFLP